MSKSEVRRFLATDDSGKLYTIIEPRLALEYDKITPDRMVCEPNIEQVFEAVGGWDVARNADGSFTILSSGVAVREARSSRRPRGSP